MEVVPLYTWLVDWEMFPGESRLKLLQPDVVPKLWNNTVAWLTEEARHIDVANTISFSFVDFMPLI
jgi:hypothetical protein